MQISGIDANTSINDVTLQQVQQALEAEGVVALDQTLNANNILVRLSDDKQQKDAKEIISRALGDDYVVALNLAPTTPAWLQNMGGRPMKLGLDLSGGAFCWKWTPMK